MSRYVSHHPTKYWGYNSSPTDMGFGDVKQMPQAVGTSIPLSIDTSNWRDWQPPKTLRKHHWIAPRTFAQSAKLPSKFWSGCWLMSPELLGLLYGIQHKCRSLCRESCWLETKSFHFQFMNGKQKTASVRLNPTQSQTKILRCPRT